MNRVGGVADKMFEAAGGDHRAVSDFITGHNMDATVTPGSKYDTDDHLLSVLEHRWDPNQHGVQNLFKWIGGPEASDPDPLLRARAGETADSLAHFLVRHEDTLALNLPGHGGDSLGKVNPGLTQSLSEAMRPYLGNFVDAPGTTLINHAAEPFETVGDLTKLFNILDSDPGAAKIINSAGSQWNDYLAYQAGLHPDQASSLGFRAGQLSSAMHDGLQHQLQALSAENQWNYARSYNEKTALTDVASSWFGAVPGVGAIAGPIASSANSWFKLDGLGAPGDPQHPLANDQTTEQLNKEVERLTNQDSLRRQFSLASGFAHNHPDVVPMFEPPATGAPGVRAPNLLLDWNSAAADKNSFKDFFQDLTDSSGNQLSRYEAGYGSGRGDDNIITTGAGPQGSSGLVR